MSDNLDFRGESKECSYRENIDRYLRLRPEGFGADEEYWTFAHDKSGEVPFMEEHLLVSRSQFHGVNSSAEIAESCRAQFPGAIFHVGDWSQVLDRTPICPRGGLVYLDTMNEPDGIRPVASSLVSQTLRRVGPGTLVCVNLCAEGRSSKKVSFETFFKRVQEDAGEMIGDIFYPPKSHAFQMATLYFLKTSGVQTFASNSIYGPGQIGGAATSVVEETVPYSWQSQFAEGIVSTWRSKVVAPTGSGKTIVMQIAAFLANKQGRKCLIVVPQCHIANPFLAANLRVGEQVHRFRIQKEHVFLGSSTSAIGSRALIAASYSQRLAEWLGSKSQETAITSTATLVRLLGSAPDLSLDDILFIQDEAHHISGVMLDGEDCSVEEARAYIEEGTHLGDFYEHLLRETKAGICIVSATHFRGDKFPIFLEKASSSFTEFVRPWADHWEWLELESFNYDCVGYSESEIIRILVDLILSEPEERHIVCVPADTHRFRKNNRGWVQEFLAELGRSGVRALDLVTITGREARKRQLFNDNETNKMGRGTEFDVVVACNMMREGTDWVPATRIHDLAPSPSQLRTTQTIGRLMRRGPTKRDVSYRAYFRNLHKNADKEEVREHVADRANVALATMVMADSFFTYSPGLDSTRTGSTPEPLHTKMARIFGDDSERMVERLTAALQANTENGKITDRTINLALSVLGCENRADPYEAMKVLKAMALKLRKFTESAEISPKLELIGTGLDPSSLRAAGFDYTVRSSGLLSFETATAAKHHALLQAVATPLQGDQAQKAALNKKVLGTTPLTKSQKTRALKAKKKFSGSALIHSTSVSKKADY